MNKIVKLLGLIMIFAFGVNTSKAQLYDVAVGIQVDSGVGESLIGPNVKATLGQYFAVEGGAVFGGGYSSFQVIPQFNYNFSEQTDGISFYLGAGASFITGGHPNKISQLTYIGTIGAEYELIDYPVSFSVDWRPRYYTQEPGFYNTMQIHKGFEPGRWGVTLKYTF